MNSVFSGTLCRVAPDTWMWCDGEPEPSVADLSPSSHYNFRCRGGDQVEVPLRACAREPDVLGWVVDGYEAGRYRVAQSGDPGSESDRVALVPWGEWDAWARAHPYGATWPRDQEARIFSRACSLGWGRAQ